MHAFAAWFRQQGNHKWPPCVCRQSKGILYKNNRGCQFVLQNCLRHVVFRGTHNMWGRRLTTWSVELPTVPSDMCSIVKDLSAWLKCDRPITYVTTVSTCACSLRDWHAMLMSMLARAMQKNLLCIEAPLRFRAQACISEKQHSPTIENEWSQMAMAHMSQRSSDNAIVYASRSPCYGEACLWKP